MDGVYVFQIKHLIFAVYLFLPKVLKINPNPAGLFGRSTGRGGEESTRIYIDVVRGLFHQNHSKNGFKSKF